MKKIKGAMGVALMSLMLVGCSDLVLTTEKGKDGDITSEEKAKLDALAKNEGVQVGQTIDPNMFDKNKLEDDKDEDVATGKQEGADISESNTNSNEGTTLNEPKESVVLDNEFAKITLIELYGESDEFWGDAVFLEMDIQNKTNKTLTFNAEEVSVDGRMVEDAFMFEEISAGKTGKATLEIKPDKRGNLPSFEENIEFLVEGYDSKEYENMFEEFIKINLK